MAASCRLVNSFHLPRDLSSEWNLWRLWNGAEFGRDKIPDWWWFGTFFIFPHIGNCIIPIDEFIFFRWVLSTTNQLHSQHGFGPANFQYLYSSTDPAVEAYLDDLPTAGPGGSGKLNLFHPQSRWSCGTAVASDITTQRQHRTFTDGWWSKCAFCFCEFVHFTW